MAHNYWRFFDNPLVGSWRHLPDDLSLQRGPTIVILPDGRRIRVPAMSKRNVQAPGDHHSAKDGEDILKSLQALLQGKKEKNHPGPLHMGRRRVGDHPGRPQAGAAPIDADMPREPRRPHAGEAQHNYPY